jgi:hypothetical protein
MKLRARSRPKADTEAEVHEWIVEAETYEQGREEAKMAVPEGWVLLSVQVLEH